jgi:hypothetical protein
LPIGKIDEQEKSLLEAAVKELGPSIEKVCLALRVSRVPEWNDNADITGNLVPARSSQALEVHM